MHDEALNRLLETNRALLEQERLRAGTELDGKKSLIDQQLVTMTGELDKVTALVRQLEGGQRKAYGELSNELRRQHEGIATLSEHTRQLREALASSKARGQWGERMAEDVLRLAGLLEGVNYRKQATLDDGSRPSRLHVPAAQRPRDAHGREVPARQLRASPRGRQRPRTQAVPRPVPARRARPGEGAHEPRLPRRERRHRRLPAPVHPQRAGLRVRPGARPRHPRRRAAHKIVLCSPLTLYAVLAVVRQAVDNFQLERTSSEILALLGEFSRQWEKYAAQLDKVQQRFEAVAKEYAALMTTRHRALQRPLDKIEHLRHEERGLLEAEMTPLTLPELTRAPSVRRMTSRTTGQARRSFGPDTATNATRAIEGRRSEPHDPGHGARRRPARMDARTGRASRWVCRSGSSTRHPRRRPGRSATSSSAALDDVAAAAKAADGSAVVTYEWEGVPADNGASRSSPTRRCIRRPARSRSPRTGWSRRWRCKRSASRPRRSGRSTTGRRSTTAIAELGLPAVLKTRRGGYDGKGQAVLRGERPTSTGRWSRARRCAADPRRRSCPSNASCRSSRCARTTARSRAGRSSRTRTRRASCASPARPRPAPTTHCRSRAEQCIRPLLDASTTSASAASSCSTPTASCSQTRSRRACTTPATGRSKAQKRASSRTISAPYWAGRSGRPTRGGVERDGQLHRRDARPRCCARSRGRAPARLRQGPAPRPQGRPRHACPRPTTAALEPRAGPGARAHRASADG